MSEKLPSLADLRGVLYSAVVQDVLDGLGHRRQSPGVALFPWTLDRVIVGRCRTTLWEDFDGVDPRPYELELRAVDACRSDDVLIAAAGGSMRSGIWGELLTTAARNGGAVGAIIDGAVRDIRAMRDLEFPVFARGMSVYDSRNRQRVIEIDGVVEIDGVRFAPGELVVADPDGVVVVPREVETEAVRLAVEKAKAEDGVREAIRRGMKATDAFDRYGVL